MLFSPGERDRIKARETMAEQQIRFEDGAAYERMMGVWSRIAGGIFLDWLAPRVGFRWIDIGCGSGAFSELLVERCAPAEVKGIDPSEAQLAFARTRPAARLAEMVRVVAPGGTIAAYAWDMLGAGYPGEPIRAELRELGLNPPLPPSVGASRIDALRTLWSGAGLDAVETREIAVQRVFGDFDEFWTTTLSAATIG